MLAIANSSSPSLSKAAVSLRMRYMPLDAPRFHGAQVLCSVISLKPRSGGQWRLAVREDVIGSPVWRLSTKVC